MLTSGDDAPDFTLPGITCTEAGCYRLSEETETGPVLLVFQPDVVQAERWPVGDALRWFLLIDDLSVFVITNDRCGRYRTRITENTFPIPVLGDFDGVVAKRYGVRTVDPESNVYRSSIFLIDRSQTVQLAECYEHTETTKAIDFGAIHRAVRTYCTIDAERTLTTIGERA